MIRPGKIEWNSSISVGNRTLDKQHKEMIDRVNRNIDICNSLSSVDIGMLRELGHFMYTYVQEHFSYEEKYMKENNYPDLNKHIEMHQSFIWQYKNFERDFKEQVNSGSFSSVEAGVFLEKVNKYLFKWVIEHIKKEDQKYAKYIKNH